MIHMASWNINNSQLTIFIFFVNLIISKFEIFIIHLFEKMQNFSRALMGHKFFMIIFNNCNTFFIDRQWKTQAWTLPWMITCYKTFSVIFFIQIVWPVLLAQVLPHPQLVFPSKIWFLGIYLNFQRQKSVENQYLPHSDSKSYQINSIKFCSSRSLQ